jgi:hypothetical protein
MGTRQWVEVGFGEQFATLRGQRFHEVRHRRLPDLVFWWDVPTAKRSELEADAANGRPLQPEPQDRPDFMEIRRSVHRANERAADAVFVQPLQRRQLDLQELFTAKGSGVSGSKPSNWR